MSKEHVLEAMNVKLFASVALAALVKENIAYARGIVTNTWPQVHYFEVTSTEGYITDYDSITVQFSVWALDKFSALRIADIVEKIFKRLHEKITVTGGVVDINWSQLIDSGALPETDPQLFGQFLRFTFRYRGENLGGF